MRCLICLLSLVILVGCRSGCVPEPKLTEQLSDTPPKETNQEVEKALPPLEVVPMEQVALSDDDLKAALQLLTSGKQAYLNGQYSAAEQGLKEALLLYPFLPEARLLLAKVLLVKGAASRELATLKMAKLMLEMALAMQPNLEEAEKLLELFSLEVDAASQ